MLTALKQFIGMFFLVLLVAGTPLMLYTANEEVQFEPDGMISHAVYLLESLAEGSLGTYYLGTTERSIADDILPFTVQSFQLLFTSVLIAVVGSLTFGLFFQRIRLVRIVQRMLDVIATIPDFILILFSIVLAVGFYKMTNVRIITLSPTSDASNNWFPTMVLALGPTIYLLRVVSMKYVQVCGEDYIATAVAKGMNVRHVQLHHVYKNIKPYFVADLKKAVAITIANLFIVEYSLNVVGLTRFIFSRSGYQFTAAVMGLLGIICLSIIVYFLMIAILYVFERSVIYK
ncbi:UNVERIFIED_CONTAM: peptide/nickel transport system permease protein [Brevibacillus sp. OAP136]|uniref:ABC transporter permease subunit n=1 Tax=Brevibacillus fluminis TaxID=511487 RepID=UPI001FE3148C|nr:ABC transporter permease subunit [Brevibacillus fluminis]